MFSNLTEKFQNLFTSFRNKKFTEGNIAEAVNEVRLALLEADVNYTVVHQFINRVKEKALGEDLRKSLSPHEQFVKLIYDELVLLMGKDEVVFSPHGQPFVIMLCGLQGSGKTTTAAKLAYYLQKKGSKKILLAACDVQRFAAIDQLKQLGSSIGVEVFSLDEEKKAVNVAKEAYKKAKFELFDVLIVDTAGRLHVDEDLMEELSEIKSIVSPQEILFVANGATGQDAVKTAVEFDKKVSITGSILTMLDGSSRAGAALSIREVTQKPLKFEGIGEKIADFQLFNASSMADRILGRGDIINLIRKAEETIDEEESKKLEKKFTTATFTFEDYLKQMKMIQKMGSMKSLMGMMPGMSNMGDLELPEKEFKKMEAMIQSMTKAEREERVDVDYSRRKRIAKGSGTSLDDVNKMVKGFERIKHVMQDVSSMKKKGHSAFGQMLGKGKKGEMPDMQEMQELLNKKVKTGGKKLWHL